MNKLRMDPMQAQFYQGFAMALAAVNRQHDQPTLVRNAMDGYAVTMAMLKASGVDEYDLKELRKAMK